MTESNPSRPHAGPRASRPHMPGYGILDESAGKGLLPWSWAVERLTEARTYWVGTTRPDGRPHMMPLWAVWLDDTVCFSTGGESVKARNLTANPNCTVGVQDGEQAVIVEGLCRASRDPEFLRRFSQAYSDKYHWDMEGFAEPVYVLRPTAVFAFSSAPGEFTATATRWTFDSSG